MLNRIRTSARILGVWLVALSACVRVASAQAATTAYTWKSVIIDGGGFVDGIVCHPKAENVVYARTDVGGAYRWNNAIQAWEQMFNWVPSSNGNAVGIESIAVDSTDPNIVYAVGGFSGNGTFFASQNRGCTWTSNTLPFVCGANNNGRQNGERLAVDPNDPAILYYGTIQNGLYRSTNRGQTWKQVTSFPVTATSDGVGIPFVQFIKSSVTRGNPSLTIFVGVSQTGNNLYESTDGGSTWAPVYSSSTLMPARAAQDGLGNMYMTYNNAPGPNGISAGAVVKLNLSTLAASTVLATPSGWEYGYGSVSVSVQNPKEVIASTIDRWWPHDGLYLTTDGGATWTDTSNSATVDISLSPWIGTQDPLGSWDGSAQIDPFNWNRAFFGTGGGATIVTDLTFPSPTYTFNSVGIEEMVPLGIGVPSTGSSVYMVFGDIGGFADTDLNATPALSEHFNTVGGTINAMDYAELDPSELAVLSPGLQDYGAYSTAGGSSWTLFTSEPSDLQTDWPGTIAVSAKGDFMVWTPGGGNQYYSNNYGASWTPSSGGTTDNWGWAAVSDRVADKVFYCYDSSAGNFLRSTDGGASFSVVSSGSLPYWTGQYPVTVPGIEGDVWQPTYAGLYHSTDGGSTWARINTGNIQCMGFGKAAPGSSYPTIFAYGTLTNSETTNGVYMSTDEGSKWTEIDDQLDRWGGVGIIKGDPNIFGRVYVGTGAFGVHYGDLAPDMPVNGTYRITNLNSGMVLDSSSSMSGGTEIVQEPYGGRASQQWLVTNLGSEQVKIVDACSGMALSVRAGSDSRGAAIVQSPWANSAYQTWRLSLESTGYYTLTNIGSGLVLDDPGWSKSAGRVQDQWTPNHGTNQQWTFTGASASAGNP